MDAKILKQLKKVGFILKNENGSSIMYVLAVMLLLLIIGVSVLTASSANAGYSAKQRDHTRGVILAESVQRNVMYSLQVNSNEEDSFSNQLLMALYSAHDTEAEGFELSPNGLGEIILKMEFSEGLKLPENIQVESVVLSFPDQDVMILEALDAIVMGGIGGDDLGLENIERVPRTAHVSANMAVTVTINVKGSQMVSRALYEFTGGELSDDPEGEYSLFTEEGLPGPLEMTIIDPGEWRLIRHEKVEL
jgi:hypothetical protein